MSAVSPRTLWRDVQHALRLLRRLLRFLFLWGPLACSAPLARVLGATFPQVEGWWWSWALAAVEASGPTGGGGIGWVYTYTTTTTTTHHQTHHHPHHQ